MEFLTTILGCDAANLALSKTASSKWTLLFYGRRRVIEWLTGGGERDEDEEGGKVRERKEEEDNVEEREEEEKGEEEEDLKVEEDKF